MIKNKYLPLRRKISTITTHYGGEANSGPGTYFGHFLVAAVTANGGNEQRHDWRHEDKIKPLQAHTHAHTHIHTKKERERARGEEEHIKRDHHKARHSSVKKGGGHVLSIVEIWKSRKTKNS